MRLTYILCFSAVCLCLLDSIARTENDHYFLKAAKSVPRIGRRSRNQNIDDSFEKFFLKASKSVPRIGRRGSLLDDFIDEDMGNPDYYQGWQQVYYVPRSKFFEGYQQDETQNSVTNQQKEIPEFRLQPDRFM